MEVFLLQQQPRRRGERPATPDPSPQEEADHRLVDTSVADGATIEGADPGLFEELREMDLDCNQVYDLANMEDLQKVSLYTANYCKLAPKAVQARGACLFASIRRNCTAPYEYTNSHLRRQIAMFMINMAEYLFPLLQVHIKGNYGHIRLTKRQYEAKERNNTLTDQERTDYLEPGPFSLVSYIEALLARDFYGDEITLVLISMMWQMRITIIHAETLLQTKICHSNIIHLTDMVVFRTKLNHYFLASKSLIMSLFHKVQLCCTGSFQHCAGYLPCHTGCSCTMLVHYIKWVIFLLPSFQSKSRFQLMRLERPTLRGIWWKQLP